NNGPNSRRWTVRLAQGRTTPRGLLSVGAGFLFPAWQLAIIRRQLCHLAGESLPRSAGAGGDSDRHPSRPAGAIAIAGATRRARNIRRRSGFSLTDTAFLIKMEWTTDERIIRHQPV